MIKVCISGPMAVGKTTVIEKLLPHAKDSAALYENAKHNNQLFNSMYSRVESLFGRDLKQMIYINDVIERLSTLENPIVFVDKGIEDILFFWKRSIILEFETKKNCSLVWSITDAIQDSFSDLIFYLDAKDDTLLSRKDNDASRSRNFFDEYMRCYRLEEREYFIRLGAICIETDHLSPNEVAGQILAEIRNRSI